MTARKKRTIIEESIPDGAILGEDGPSEFDVSLESVEDTEALQDVLSQFGETNVTLKILRQTATGSEFCYQTDVLDEEFIQKNFGGGDYNVRVFINGRFKKTLKVKIASRLVNPQNPTVTAVSDSHSQFLEKMLLALLTKESTPSTTPVGELAEALTKVHQLQPPPVATAATSAKDMMDSFFKGVEFAKDLTGGEAKDWKSELIGAAKTALPSIMEGISMARGNTPPLNSQPNPIVTGAQPTPDQMLVALRQGIAYLKKKAIAGSDPMLFVDWITENADDEQYQFLIRSVLTKDFSEFVAIDSEIGSEPFKQWFGILFDGLRSAFTPPNPVDEHSIGDSGDGVHGSVDASTRKNGKSKTKG